MTNGHSQVELAGTTSGKFYYNFLEASTNLTDWRLVPREDFPYPFRVILLTNTSTQWLDPFTNSPGPRFYRAFNASEACISNLALIYRVKTVWALEQGKGVRQVPTDSDLFGPGKYLLSKPTCPLGGWYTPTDVGSDPYCSLMSWGHSLY
jgi:hypothetical protein